MPVLTLNQTDPTGQLTSAPRPTGFLDGLVEAAPQVAGIVQGLKNRKREKKFKGPAEAAIQAELAKMAAGEDSNLGLEFDPATGEMKIKRKASNALDTSRAGFLDAKTKDIFDDLGLNPDGSPFQDTPQPDEDAIVDGANSLRGNEGQTLIEKMRNAFNPKKRGQFNSPEEADASNPAGTEVFVNGRPYLTG